MVLPTCRPVWQLQFAMSAALCCLSPAEGDLVQPWKSKVQCLYASCLCWSETCMSFPSVFGESSIVLLVSQVIERFSTKSYWHILYINPSCANSHVASFYHNELSMSLPFLVRRLCPPWTALEPAMACVAFVLRLQSTALWNSPRTCSNFYDSMHFNRRGLLGFVAMKSVHIT